MVRLLLLYLQALRRHWLGLLTGPTASFLLLAWQVFRHTDIPAWVFWVVAGGGIPVAGFLAWKEEHERAEKVTDVKATQARADMRIGDDARQLRRNLLASFEEWGGRDPSAPGELMRWAANKFAGSSNVTERALRDLVRQRADASPAVQDAIGRARDRYYEAADLVNPLVTTSGITVTRETHDSVMASIRKAVGHVRACLRELDV